MSYAEIFKNKFDGTMRTSQDILQLTAAAEFIYRYTIENFREDSLDKFGEKSVSLNEVFLTELNEAISGTKIDIDLISKNIPFIIAEFEEHTFREYLKTVKNILDGNQSAYELVMENISMGMEGLEYLTSISLNNLILKILDVQQEDSVLNATAGYGDILKDILDSNNEQKIVAQETNQLVYELLKLRFYFNKGSNSKVYNGNILNKCMYIKNDRMQTFDKVISQPPFGLNLTNSFEKEDRYNRFPFGRIPLSKADWAFISNGIMSLNDTGKGVFIAPLGICFRGGSEKRIRENILELDIIESVIQLPAGIFYPGTTIPIVVLVINKQKNADGKGKIQLVNMSDTQLEKIDMKNHITEETIYEIMSLLKNRKEVQTKSVILSIEQIKDANILPDKYLYKSEIYIEDLGKFSFDLDSYRKIERVKLEEIATINRGLTTTAKDETEDSEIKIIKISDLNDEKIDYSNLSNIYEGKVTSKKYFVKENDVIVSNRGNTFKTAIIEENVQDVILSQNFVKIRLTTNEFLPSWIKLFLDSPIGKGYLDLNAEGSAVRILSTNAIKEMEIPKIPKEQQLKIINHYQKKQQEIQRKIIDLEKELVQLKLETYDSMGLQNSYKKIEE
ncbi:N-6 DNA methylase [Enterococcus ureasiticus]|uniref:N-6 DNA methylase n=1 Tax=Enterococcus ureasiticus TaxID=903984 RepID=UPI001A8EF245|nr:N-6 DNA methylase [Enterococcus ureasiticus]MBO0472852.1 N-6 DNA methylase [Enterococcus ureasiticus]